MQSPSATLATPMNIFIGFDNREVPAFHVLLQSILDVSSRPVNVLALDLRHLRHCYWRQRDPKQSTEFSFSRFLVPYLSGYQGWSLFLDSDMLVFSDIGALWELRDPKYAVMVIKHDYECRNGTKFFGEKQVPYPKKNWSSLMLFNNARCKRLTPEYVNTATGLELHQFKWLACESEIGALPISWNHLVGEYEYSTSPCIAHFTLGGPWWNEYKHCDYSDQWFSSWRRTALAQQAGTTRPWLDKDVLGVNIAKTMQPVAQSADVYHGAP